jgi:lysophospholipase L1-like esterase
MKLTAIKNQCIFCVFLLTTLIVTACDKPTVIPPLPREAVILAFGDSLTFGTGAPSGQSYPDTLAALLNRQVINAGVPGEVSAAGLDRLPRLLEKHHPALVILCHGGNDFLHRRKPGLVRNNLRAMVELSRAAGAQVLLIGVPDFNLMLSTHPLYERLAENLRIAYNGEIVSQLLSDRSLKSDRIHPNAEGYRLMAEAIARQIPLLPTAN